MAKPRLSIRKIKEILRLSYQCGLSRGQAAQSSKVGRSTVGDYLWRAKQAGVGWPLPENEAPRPKGRGFFQNNFSC